MADQSPEPNATPGHPLPGPPVTRIAGRAPSTEIVVTTVAVADPKLEARCDRHPGECAYADDGDRHLVRVLCSCGHAIDFARPDAADLAGIVLRAIEDTIARGPLRLPEAVELLGALAPVSDALATVSNTLARLNARAVADGRADAISDLDPLVSRLLDTPGDRGGIPPSERLPDTSPAG